MINTVLIMTQCEQVAAMNVNWLTRNDHLKEFSHAINYAIQVSETRSTYINLTNQIAFHH